MKKQMIKRGRGGIGRRAGFRYQWRESWGFESLRPHHLTDSYVIRREPALGQCVGGNCWDPWNYVKPAQVDSADLGRWSKKPDMVMPPYH
jgi:hypothetical protein